MPGVGTLPEASQRTGTITGSTPRGTARPSTIEAPGIALPQPRLLNRRPVGLRPPLLPLPGANFGSEGRWPGLHQAPASWKHLVLRSPHRAPQLPEELWADFPRPAAGPGDTSYMGKKLAGPPTHMTRVPGEEWILQRRRREEEEVALSLQRAILRQCHQKIAFEERRRRNGAFIERTLNWERPAPRRKPEGLQFCSGVNMK